MKKRYTLECVPLVKPPATFPHLEVQERYTATGAVKAYRRLSAAFPAYHFWIRKNW